MPLTTLAAAYQAAVQHHGTVIAHDDRSDPIADTEQPPPCVYTVGLTAAGKPELHLTYGPTGQAPDVQTAAALLADLADLAAEAADLPDPLICNLQPGDARHVTTADLPDPQTRLPIAATIYSDLRAVTVALEPATTP